MKNDGNGHESLPQDPDSRHTNSDDDTAELPVLTVDEAEDSTRILAPPELSDLARARATTSESRATTWVADMETEIEQLRERWRTLDRELRRSEERMGKLRAESEEKDKTISELNTQVASHLEHIDELSVTIVERDASIASLEARTAKQDERIAEQSDKLNETKGAAAVLEDRLQAIRSERDELRQNMGDDRTRLIEATTERDAIAATNKRLATRVQDLEIYIEGRRDKWTALNAELESSKAKVAQLEATISADEKQLEGRGSEVESLKQRIVELECSRSEAEGRHKERDSAYQETQARLMEQAAEIERLQARASTRDSRERLADEAAEKQREEMEKLAGLLEEKKEAIREVEAELKSSRSLIEHIEEQRSDDKKLISALQEDIVELVMERERMSESLAAVTLDKGSVDKRMEDAEAHVVALEAENAARQSQIAELKAEVAEKGDLINAFDRNAKRLLALRHDLHSVSNAHADEEMINAEATESRTAPDETSPIGQPGQPMIVSLDADGSTRRRYSLSKPVTTIGRGSASDIRILDAIVSRLHARLTTDQDVTIIEDLGSKNGVFVNEQPVDRAVLQDGDIISFGADHDFRYLESGRVTH
jgi:chromosome segregation ATPase